MVVTGMHARAVKAVSGRLGVAKDAIADDLSRSVGQTGAAHRAWCWPLLESEAPARPQATGRRAA